MRDDDLTKTFDAMFAEPLKLWDQLVPEGVKGGELGEWAAALQTMQSLWLDFARDQATRLAGKAPAMAADPGNWLSVYEGWVRALPLTRPEVQQKLWADGVALWQGVLGQYGLDGKPAGGDGPELPRKDRRFADPKWREQPFFALVHQTYLMVA
ncbi:MAG: hypothetical protein ACK442_06480, partial [Novosphingobium sp.]